MSPVRNNEQKMNNENVSLGYRSGPISNGMKITARVLFVIVLFTALPFSALAQAQPQAAAISGGITFTLGGGGVCSSPICVVAGEILYIINGVLVPLLFAVAFIVFLYGIAKTYIFSVGDPEEVKKGHKLLLWGIIAFAIMISIWGLVNVVADTFGLNGIGAPLLPYSPY